MNTWRSLLPKYTTILEGNGISQFLNCRSIPVSFNPSARTTELWRIHENAFLKMKIQDTPPAQSLLDLKIEIAHRLFQSCCFCEQNCRVNREKTKGKCGVQESQVASEFLHFGEEPPLVPSYTIFFSGCTFQCVFCQNWDISQCQCGIHVPPITMAEKITQRQRQGARNVNWVGGDPTPNLPFILEVLKKLDVNIPQVWNSNMYCSKETMTLLQGIIDVYLTDFKYGNDSCAHRLSKVERYLSVVTRNHVDAYRNGEVILRHLVMPNHRLCCSYPILEWTKQNTPDILVNVMGQYRPEYHADEYEEIAHAVSGEEYHLVREYAEHLGLFLI
jgi:putative pyruvate formate lyase activating enzyme